MGQILSQEDEVIGLAPTTPGTSVTILRRQVTAGDNHYTVLVASRLDILHESGKRATRWRTDQMTTLRKTKRGYWLLLERFRATKGHPFTQSHRVFGGTNYAAWGSFPWAAAREHFGHEPATFNEIFPLIAEYAARRAEDIPLDWAQGELLDLPPAFVDCWVGVETAIDLTRKLFGVRRYNKALVKAVAQATVKQLYVAWSLRGLMPTDWLTSWLLTSPNLPGRIFISRPHLKGMPPTQVRALMRDLPNAQHWELHDLAKMPVFDVGKVRTWRQLHDRTVARHRALLAMGDKPFKPVELSAEATAVCGQTPAGRTVALADRLETLIEWGDTMDHCIASYGRAIQQGQWLGGVYEGSKLVANFHVRHNRALGCRELVQLQGKSNRAVPEELASDVAAHLTAHAVRVPA